MKRPPNAPFSHPLAPIGEASSIPREEAFDRDRHYLALDMDGVIVDSIGECLVVGYNAFVRFSGTGRPIQCLSDLPDQDLTEARRLRGYIRSGEDYVYLFFAMAEGAMIHSQDDFDAFTASHADLKERFYRLFYSVRTELSESDPARWASLNPLYPGMHDFLSAYAPKDRLWILTTKEARFGSMILAHHGVPFDPERILHAGHDRPKRLLLQSLAHSLAVDPETFFFVDDQVDTLLKVRPLGVRCHLAGWGYCNPDQVSRARGAGIPVLSLEDFFHTF